MTHELISNVVIAGSVIMIAIAGYRIYNIISGRYRRIMLGND
jgi:hypothetical protein